MSKIKTKSQKITLGKLILKLILGIVFLIFGLIVAGILLLANLPGPPYDGQ